MDGFAIEPKRAALLLKEAILGYLEALEKSGEPLPRERKPVALEVVTVTMASRRRAKA